MFDILLLFFSFVCLLICLLVIFVVVGLFFACMFVCLFVFWFYYSKTLLFDLLIFVNLSVPNEVYSRDASCALNERIYVFIVFNCHRNYGIMCVFTIKHLILENRYTFLNLKCTIRGLDESL